MKALAIRGDYSLQTRAALTSEMFSRFTEYIDGSAKTIETYTRAIRQFTTWIQAQGIDRPDRADVLRYLEHLRSHCKPTTVQNYIIAVRQFFKWAEQEGIYDNIAEHVKGAKLDREHKKDALTTAQIRDIAASIDRDTLQGKRDYAILTLTVTCGLRTIELQRANIEDMRTLGDNSVLYIQGKGREEKTEYVKLPQLVEKAIRAYLKARAAVAPAAPLFASTSDRNSGERMTTRSLSRLIKNSFINAGYDSDRLTAHSLRHTAGTLNLLNGGTLEETQQLLRHSKIDTTMIYLHHLDRAKNKSEDRISRAIFG